MHFVNQILKKFAVFRDWTCRTLEITYELYKSYIDKKHCETNLNAFLKTNVGFKNQEKKIGFHLMASAIVLKKCVRNVRRKLPFAFLSNILLFEYLFDARRT